MAAKLVARVVGGPWRRASEAWSSLDAHAHLFRSEAEQAEWMDRARESNTALKRAQMRDYSMRSVVPRLAWKPGSLLPSIQATVSDKPHGLSPTNRLIVELGISAVVALLMGATGLYFVYTTPTAGHGKPLGASPSVFHVPQGGEALPPAARVQQLEARLELLEREVLGARQTAVHDSPARTDAAASSSSAAAGAIDAAATTQTSGAAAAGPAAAGASHPSAAGEGQPST